MYVHTVIHRCEMTLSGNAYIMDPPKNTTAKEGSRVKLSCKAEGSPNNITYHWLHNGDNVQRSVGLMTRASIYADGSFVINNVIKEDTGWYKCQPTNGLGPPPEARAFLTVTCEYRSLPGRPINNLPNFVRFIITGRSETKIGSQM